MRSWPEKFCCRGDSFGVRQGALPQPPTLYHIIFLCFRYLNSAREREPIFAIKIAFDHTGLCTPVLPAVPNAADCHTNGDAMSFITATLPHYCDDKRDDICELYCRCPLKEWHEGCSANIVAIYQPT